MSKSSEVDHTEVVEARGDWVTFRPELKLLDCTVRDGGLMNNHQFDDSFVKAVYDALVNAGVDYMEMGYKGSKDVYPRRDHGPWRYCDEEDVRRIVGDNPTDLRLSAMADAERCDYRKDILPSDDSVLNLIRVACYVHQIPTALDMIHDAHEKGYEVATQLMAVANVRDSELEKALEAIQDSPTGMIYLVDSWGSLYSEQIRSMVKKYLSFCEPVDKKVGFHGHNNQQLAYANTIEAIILGANCVDGTMYGMGRGAGNCPLELLLNFLKNPKFQIRPVIHCIQEHVRPLHSQLRWGPEIPYMITGQMNEHPRAAMEFMDGDNPDDFVAFYDQMLEEE